MELTWKVSTQRPSSSNRLLKVELREVRNLFICFLYKYYDSGDFLVNFILRTEQKSAKYIVIIFLENKRSNFSQQQSNGNLTFSLTTMKCCARLAVDPHVSRHMSFVISLIYRALAVPLTLYQVSMLARTQNTEIWFFLFFLFS